MRHKRLGIKGQKAIRHLTLYLHRANTQGQKTIRTLIHSHIHTYGEFGAIAGIPLIPV